VRRDWAARNTRPKICWVAARRGRTACWQRLFTLQRLPLGRSVCRSGQGRCDHRSYEPGDDPFHLHLPLRTWACHLECRLRLPIAALTRALVVLLILTAAAGATVASSGDTVEGKQNAPAKASGDPLGRNTPQGMVKGLMAALANGDYERAEHFFEKGESIPRSRHNPKIVG
jgi:hypothetical protein